MWTPDNADDGNMAEASPGDGYSGSLNISSIR